jgi:hypothetical protein
VKSFLFCKYARNISTFFYIWNRIGFWECKVQHNFLYFRAEVRSSRKETATEETSQMIRDKGKINEGYQGETKAWTTEESNKKNNRNTQIECENGKRNKKSLMN